jgi:Kef-type K+ transport system membrane component KefB
MGNPTVFFTVFLIFTGAAVMSTFVLLTRQSLLVAYILLGAIFGPWGLKWVQNIEMVQQVGEVGILFLLFLLGLHLQPQNLFHMLRKVTWVALISSVAFLLLGYVICIWFGFSHLESLIIGASLMFSSTIIGLKLLPTTILHHKHTGEVMISVLLMQDLIAIVVLILLNGAEDGGFSAKDIISLVIALPALTLFAFLFEKFVLIKLLARFDRTQEYVFLLAVGWCLALAQLAKYIGLSEDIGAFVAGVSLAASPISLYIAESLKPLRDFFLVMFFFSIGATFDFSFAKAIIIPAGILSVIILIIKPLLYWGLLTKTGENSDISLEVGVRLGQASEFSLLVASLALTTSMLSAKAANLIQATTILTFIVSSYIVVLYYPTPIALSDSMRKD